jgi:hypothetical protein
VIYGHILILFSCPGHHHHEQSPVNAGKLNIVRGISQKVPLFPKLSPTDHAKPISTLVPSFLSVSQQKNALLLLLFEATSLNLKHILTSEQSHDGCFIVGCGQSGAVGLHSGDDDGNTGRHSKHRQSFSSAFAVGAQCTTSANIADLYVLTLKMATAVLAETVDNCQHATRFIPGGRSWTRVKLTSVLGYNFSSIQELCLK